MRKIFLSFGFALATPIYADILINEIAWMGTTNHASDEWIELYNPTSFTINIDGWRLQATDGTPDIPLSGAIPAGSYLILERTDDTTEPNIGSDLIYTGALENGGEQLVLVNHNGTIIDSVSTWIAGSNDDKATMERNTSDWNTTTTDYIAGLGTPKAINSQTPPPTPAPSPQPPSNSGIGSDAPSSINVYFNKPVLKQYASIDNEAYDNVNLEEQLVARLAQATESIDLAVYEINLPDIVNMLIKKASIGITVRLIVDTKNPKDADHTTRYRIMRLYIEKMLRGADNVAGTSDDIKVFSDSPIFAVEETTTRVGYGLPASMSDLSYVTAPIGNQLQTGFLLSQGETKFNGNYYSAIPQMHNKFVIIDHTWVWTGSWNFTVTGLYGTEENRIAGKLAGNTQHAVEIHLPVLAAIYTDEFNEMWGSSTTVPSLENSNFHSRKIDNTQQHVTVGGKSVEVYFSPGDDALGKTTNYVVDYADNSVLFPVLPGQIRH